jgi:hypothetical protein
VSGPIERDDDDSRHWAALRRRLGELKPLLETQGSLVRRLKRGQGYWYLRYYEPGPRGRRQRTVYVGRDEQARRVQHLLDAFRAPGKFLDDTLKLVEVARCVVRPLRRRHGPGNQESADGTCDP